MLKPICFVTDPIVFLTLWPLPHENEPSVCRRTHCPGSVPLSLSPLVMHTFLRVPFNTLRLWDWRGGCVHWSPCGLHSASHQSISQQCISNIYNIQYVPYSFQINVVFLSSSNFFSPHHIGGYVITLTHQTVQQEAGAQTLDLIHFVGFQNGLGQ